MTSNLTPLDLSETSKDLYIPTMNKDTFLSFFEDLLRIDVNIYIFNKQFYEASAILMVFNCLVSDCNNRYSNFLLQYNFDFSIIQEYKRKILEQITKDIVEITETQIINKYLRSYLIVSEGDVLDVFRFYLDSKRLYFQQILSGGFQEPQRSSIDNLVKTLISTVKNSAYFVKSDDMNTIYQQAYDISSDSCTPITLDSLCFDENFKQLRKFIGNLDDFCNKKKERLAFIDQEFVQRTISEWINETKDDIELAIDKATQKLEFYTSLCEAFTLDSTIIKWFDCTKKLTDEMRDLNDKTTNVRKVHKICIFSSLTRLTISDSISFGFSTRFDPQTDEYEPAKNLMTILCCDLINQYLMNFENITCQKFVTTFQRIKIPSLSESTQREIAVPHQISTELFEALSTLNQEFHSSINTFDYSNSTLSFVSKYLNENIWKSLYDAIKRTKCLNIDQIIQLYFDAKFLQIFLIQVIFIIIESTIKQRFYPYI
ncbi:hypothetical protein RF11_13342 [Thelohanellus kitauei]|uniref:Uncharacterized protein n=1 Tax=Thelohanellus kitauei TaxID=669202 RepID=A0A0C2IWY8_THEKT|nr:hypothetical protein RF11_13342 [Thelohanellus kitauei]